jgi:hypothetical protein
MSLRRVGDFYEMEDFQESNLVDLLPKTLLFGMQNTNNGIAKWKELVKISVMCRELLSGNELPHLILLHVLYESSISPLNHELSIVSHPFGHH